MRDLVAIGFMLGVIAFAIIAGLCACLLCHWLCNVFARAGATEWPAQGLAYLIALGSLAFVISSIGGRVTGGGWWWRE